MNIKIQDIISIVKESSLIMTSSTFTISKKNGFSDIVTSCDLKIQDFLCNSLQKLVPGSSFLCEESNIDNNNLTDVVWIIDPIDGTTNFARGFSDCCISVALKIKGEICMGVVYSPFKKELYYAEKGKGAFLNDAKINVSNRVFEDGILCTAMSLYDKQFSRICSDIIYETYCRCNDIRRFGSCALELCYLAIGKCDLYFEYRVQPWDYAAAFLILKEAGGYLTNVRKEKLTCDVPTMLIGANCKENLDELLCIVQEHLNK